jgi:hypothetical protein
VEVGLDGGEMLKATTTLSSFLRSRETTRLPGARRKGSGPRHHRMTRAEPPW